MVLEETLTLNDVDDAEDLVRTLGGAGMTARISRMTELDRSLIVTGEPLTTEEGEITLRTDLEYLRVLLADLQKARVVRKSGAAFRAV